MLPFLNELWRECFRGQECISLRVFVLELFCHTESINQKVLTTLRGRRKAVEDLYPETGHEFFLLSIMQDLNIVFDTEGMPVQDY